MSAALGMRLRGATTLRSAGAGGVYIWVDPANDIVGVYFAVIPVPDTDPRYTEFQDLFTDAVTAAVVDQ